MSTPIKQRNYAELLRNWLQRREDEMAALLAELVAVPTENPPGRNYREFVELLVNRTRKLGLAFERVASNSQGERAAEDRLCLCASYGRGERALYFHGHYDVVPAQSPEQFHPQRKEHFLFGRGACDMKGGIVAMLYTVLMLQEFKVDLNGRVNLVLVPDEETGGARGSAWLDKQGALGKKAIGMLLAEPTSGVVWNANRGAISLRVHVQGKSAHVGLQHQGVNAFERMYAIVERLQELKREVEQRASKCNVGAEQARNSILMLGGQSGGGTNFNVVPATCSFTIDRRINPEENLAEEKARLIGVLEQCRHQGISLDWEVLQEGNSSASREDQAPGRALARAIEEVTENSAHFEMCPGLLETRFYAA
jgi:succinyl-diaminopimelate desuccinylase